LLNSKPARLLTKDRKKVARLFSIAAEEWLKNRTSIAASTKRSYTLAISHLKNEFGKQLLCDISGNDVAAYQTRRKGEDVSNRTINLEIGVLRSILRRNRIWEGIAQDVEFLTENPSPGRALTEDEETRLLNAASKSRCRSLYPLIMLAINTGMRVSEIRGLTWGRVDFFGNSLIVANPK
jgi:integrase